MSHLIGRGRYARETYPTSSQNAATVALRNRNVSAPASMTAFTPATQPSLSLVAALLYTPKVSGVIQVSAILDLTNGVAPDTYVMLAFVATGTGLSVSGGESSSNGWFVGSPAPGTPIVVGGAGIVLSQLLGEDIATLAALEAGTLDVTAAISSSPLAVGVPVVIEVLIVEVGGGNALAAIAFTSLSILELP